MKQSNSQSIPRKSIIAKLKQLERENKKLQKDIATMEDVLDYLDIMSPSDERAVRQVRKERREGQLFSCAQVKKELRLQDSVLAEHIRKRVARYKKILGKGK